MTRTSFAVLLVVAAAMSVDIAFSFSNQPMTATSPTTRASRHAVLQQTSNDDMDKTSSDRRSFLAESTVTATALLLGSTTGFWGIPSATTSTTSNGVVPVANAVSGMSKVNSKLLGYGLPPVGPVPDGFTPLLEIYGKGKNRFPLLVTFCHPLTWVVTLPNNDVNGEDGTIQAGEYAKGDTATLYVYSDAGHVDNIASKPKELFEEALMKAIGQKGVNMYQNFKVTKLVPTTYGDKQYMLADFKYQLLTGAGFEVDRKGVASITSEGPAIEVLWAASTTNRFKKTEPALRDIVASFRCYADGINLAEELYSFD